MKNSKSFAGYINLKPINGVIFPSYSQNLMNKAFVEENLNANFFMSTNENQYSDNSIVLHSLILEKNNIAGIVMLSAFLLPEDSKHRKKIYLNLFKKKKKLYFIFEKLELSKKNDVENLEEYLIFTNKFFTKKKSTLTSNEKKLFIDKDWSFV